MDDEQLREKAESARAKGRELLASLPDLSPDQRKWAERQGDILIGMTEKFLADEPPPGANPAAIPAAYAYALAIAQECYKFGEEVGTHTYTGYSIFPEKAPEIAPIDMQATGGFIVMFRSLLPTLGDKPTVLPPVADPSNPTAPLVRFAFWHVEPTAAVALWSEGGDEDALTTAPDAVTVLASGISAQADAAAFIAARRYIDVPDDATTKDRPCAVTIFRTTKGADNSTLQTLVTALAGAFSALMGTM